MVASLARALRARQWIDHSLEDRDYGSAMVDDSARVATPSPAPAGSPPDPAADAWPTLAARLAAETAWRRRVIEEITDAIVRELPELGHDSELTAAVRDSVDDNSRLFMTMVERGLDPAS